VLPLPSDADAEVVLGVLRHSDGDRKIQGYMLGPTRRSAEGVWSVYAGYSPGDLQSSYRIPVRRKRGSGAGASDDFEIVPMHAPDSPLPRLRPGTMFLYKGYGVSLANINTPLACPCEARFIGIVLGERGKQVGSRICCCCSKSTAPISSSLLSTGPDRRASIATAKGDDPPGSLTLSSEPPPPPPLVPLLPALPLPLSLLLLCSLPLPLHVQSLSTSLSVLLPPLLSLSLSLPSLRLLCRAALGGARRCARWSLMYLHKASLHRLLTLGSGSESELEARCNKMDNNWKEM